jgi:putative sigma-54 modulation protein
MHINLTGHKMDLTPALRSFTQEKMDKLEKHYDKIMSVNVVFDVDKFRQIAEATVLVAKGELHASSESSDMYTAIDELVDKLDRQLIKHKEKQQAHRDHRDHSDYLS